MTKLTLKEGRKMVLNQLEEIDKRKQQTLQKEFLENISDSDILNWLDRNLLYISHDRMTHSVDMAGNKISYQFTNEARGSGGGPSTIRGRSRNLREAVISAMSWKKE